MKAEGIHSKSHSFCTRKKKKVNLFNIVLQHRNQKQCNTMQDAEVPSFEKKSGCTKSVIMQVSEKRTYRKEDKPEIFKFHLKSSSQNPPELLE